MTFDQALDLSFVFAFVFFAVWLGSRDLSSPNRNWTQALRSGKHAKSQPPDCQGIPMDLSFITYKMGITISTLVIS